MVYLDYSSTLNNGMSVHVEHRDDGSVISLDGVEWELMGEVPEAVMSVLDDSTQAELLDYIRDSRYDYLMVNHI